MKDLLNNLHHAFYTLYDIASDNMPDAEDEYTRELQQSFDEAYAEFKEAWDAIQKKLSEKET